jgi:hypothetical protein
MKPVEFKHQNTVFAKNQPEYLPLPALKLDTPEGEVVSCWKLTFKERLRVLIFGEVWLSLTSYNKPLTPSFIAVNRKDIYSHPDDDVWYRKLRKTLLMKKCLRHYLTGFARPSRHNSPSGGGKGVMDKEEKYIKDQSFTGKFFDGDLVREVDTDRIFIFNDKKDRGCDFNSTFERIIKEDKTPAGRRGMMTAKELIEDIESR